MNELWIVRFVRKDGKPDEEYYYRSLAKVEYHKNLFLDDEPSCMSALKSSTTNIKEDTMKLNFVKSGDYYIPDIQLQNPNIHLGKWGLMRKSYLRIAQPFLLSELVLSKMLYPHCVEIEATAKSRMNVILPQLMKHYGVTERLKAANQLEWVRQMNACVAQAEEIIKHELIYS